MPLKGSFKIVPVNKNPKLLMNGYLCWEFTLRDGAIRCFVTMLGNNIQLGQPSEFAGMSWKASDWAYLYRKNDIGDLKHDIITVACALRARYLKKHNPNQLTLEV